ncbi:MAG: DUF262 domain-containing protein [Enterocloster citroniae]|nr:DUF262 domain-containing protein [Enterocloster citroniae]
MPVKSLRGLLEETERYENELVGIESEDKGEENIDDSPYSPDDVRISQHMYSVYQVHHWIEKGVLTLSPDFQRNMVWDIQRKSLLIESLMLKIPIPAFYFQEDINGDKLVIDGLQRLSTIYSYMEDSFRLKGLQYLENYNGYCYSQLPRKYKTRIEETQMAVNILDSKCHELVKFDVFRRVNTGGVPLNPQEIRNSMATPDTRSLLKQMSESEEFIKATRGRVKDIRMDAQELCLRFIAFWMRYDSHSGQLSHLMALTRMLDRTLLELNQKKKDYHLLLCALFKNSMEKCHALFGEEAFSKEDLNLIINRPLFVSWSVVMATCTLDMETLQSRRNEAIELQHKYFGGGEYYNAITSSTATKKNMELQFEGVRRILEELFYDR